MTISIALEKGVDRSWPLLRGTQNEGQPLCALKIHLRIEQHQNLDEAARMVADRFMRAIVEGSKGRLQVALLLADPTIQNKSALALKKDFWVSVHEYLFFPKFAARREAAIICDREGTFRRAGIALLDRHELVEAAPVLRKTRTAALLLRHITHGPVPVLRELASAAFGLKCDSVQVNWPEFIPACLKRELIPGRLLGEFDDQVVGIDLFGEFEALSRLKAGSAQNL